MVKNQEKHGGFTLIELVVVMAIIAVLALLVIGAIVAARNAQKRTVHRGNAATIQTAMEAMYTKNQAYPVIGTALLPVGGDGLFDAGEPLNGNGSINLTGTTCSNGGVTVYSSANSYTIQAKDTDCTNNMGNAITN